MNTAQSDLSGQKASSSKPPPGPIIRRSLPARIAVALIISLNFDGFNLYSPALEPTKQYMLNGHLADLPGVVLKTCLKMVTIFQIAYGGYVMAEKMFAATQPGRLPRVRRSWVWRFVFVLCIGIWTCGLGPVKRACDVAHDLAREETEVTPIRVVGEVLVYCCAVGIAGMAWFVGFSQFFALPEDVRPESPLKIKDEKSECA